ncbi:WXG100 family type VII secretion target [Kitasatospora sp. NPDC056800]|uniref:WXG100 family type VII secretion target n=1 Tax=Kitasatospora sp. NPDC056800 TaxID=3345948 RepID=UPI00369314B6
MAGTTDFGGIDHPVLKGMVDGAKPTEVLKRAGQLQDAGRVLSELSTALQAHLGKVTWEGPAAENFKTWVGNLYKSAAIISQHATTAGGAMTQAGEALSTARSAVPKPPETEIQTMNRHNSQSTLLNVPQLAVGQTVDDYMKTVNPKWVTAAEFNQAKAKVEKEHQEAILQMEKLAQAYSAATTTLNGIDDNVSLPGTPGTGGDRDSKTTYPVGGGSGGGQGGSVRNPRSGGGSVGGGSDPSGGGGYGGGKVLPRDPGSDGPGPSNPGNTPPPPHGGGGQLPPAPQDPGTSIPPSYPSDPVNRPGTDLNSLPTLPTLPTQTGPYGPGGGQLPTDGPTTLPGYPNGPSGPGGGPGVPGGGPVTGFPGGPGGGTVPTKGGGSGYVPGKGGGQIPVRTTPFGGGPGQGRSGTPGLPSGTVFGAREAGPGGGGRVGGPGGMGGGMHPGMGGAHGGAVGAGGGSRGRGLSSTTGGTVGGRKGPTAGGEFTPGGTGLRNRAAGVGEGGPQARQNGMMAPGAAGHGGRKERDRRQRADYLHEDEETWTSGTPHSNPDVIE